MALEPKIGISPLLLTSAEGELVDLIEEFSDGRIQFAFVKVKDPNTTLPKSVLIAWVCSYSPKQVVPATDADHANSAVLASPSEQRDISAAT